MREAFAKNRFLVFFAFYFITVSCWVLHLRNENENLSAKLEECRKIRDCYKTESDLLRNEESILKSQQIQLRNLLKEIIKGEVILHRDAIKGDVM